MGSVSTRFNGTFTRDIIQRIYMEIAEKSDEKGLQLHFTSQRPISDDVLAECWSNEEGLFTIVVGSDEANSRREWLVFPLIEAATGFKDIGY